MLAQHLLGLPHARRQATIDTDAPMEESQTPEVPRVVGLRDDKGASGGRELSLYRLHVRRVDEGGGVGPG
jgi:hypothetical protein